ncbi:MAG: hypothetical protein IJN48_02450 [Clostridia bacterium]|nr:hypothetical protein [Clostridia bacterium]
MKTLKTKTMHVGNTAVSYSTVYSNGSYGLEISAKGGFEGYIFVEDVARDIGEADAIMELFAENTVFPDNALEIFDDLLGLGKDFTYCS